MTCPSLKQLKTGQCCKAVLFCKTTESPKHVFDPTQKKTNSTAEPLVPLATIQTFSQSDADVLQTKPTLPCA